MRQVLFAISAAVCYAAGASSGGFRNWWENLPVSGLALLAAGAAIFFATAVGFAQWKKKGRFESLLLINGLLLGLSLLYALTHVMSSLLALFLLAQLACQLIGVLAFLIFGGDRRWAIAAPGIVALLGAGGAVGFAFLG